LKSCANLTVRFCSRVATAPAVFGGWTLAELSRAEQRPDDPEHEYPDHNWSPLRRRQTAAHLTQLIETSWGVPPATQRVVRRLLACRRLLHRGLDEAQRRGLLPPPDDLRVAWDEACADGRAKPGDDSERTLVEVVALLVWPATFGPMAEQEAADWCGRLRVYDPASLVITIAGLDARTVTFTAASTSAIEVAGQLNEQAREAGVPVVFDVDDGGAAGSYFVRADLIDQGSADALDTLPEDRPAAPPIGRSLARRLNRGRRRR
jgi:hypothetical protein